MRQVTRTCGVAIAAGMMAFGLAPPAAAHDLDSDRFRVTTRTISEHFNDVGKKGPSVGDSFTGTEKLFHRGERVGRDAVGCDVTKASKKLFRLHCVVTLSLRGRGDITAQGGVTFKRGQTVRNTVAITGGTGDYAGASGVIRLIEERGQPSRLQVRLQG